MLHRLAYLRSSGRRLLAVRVQRSVYISTRGFIRFNSSGVPKTEASPEVKIETLKTELKVSQVDPVSVPSSQPILTPFNLTQSNKKTQDEISETLKNIELDSVLTAVAACLPEDPADLRILSVSLPETITGYPVRVHLPNLPDNLTADSLNEYVFELASYSYFYLKQKTAVLTILQGFLQNADVVKMLNKQSFLVMLEFFAGREQFQDVYTIIKLLPEGMLDGDFYEVLFRHNDRRRPIKILERYIWEMKKYHVPLDSRLLYQIYYIVPDKQKFADFLESKGYSVDEIVPDIKYTTMENTDELLELVMSRKIEPTQGVYERLLALLLDEQRFTDASALLSSKRTRRWSRLTPKEGYMFIDSLIAADQSYFVIPFATWYERFSNNETKHYAFEKLIENGPREPISKQWISRMRVLCWRAKSYNDTKLRYNLPRMLDRYAKDNGHSPVGHVKVKRTETEKFSNLMWPTKPQFVLGENASSFADAVKRFFKNSGKLLDFKKFVRQSLSTSGPAATWKLVEEKVLEDETGKFKGRILSEAGSSFVDHFLNSGKPNFALATAAFLKAKYSVDIRSGTYCKMVSHYLSRSDYAQNETVQTLVQWLFAKTKVYSGFWRSVSNKKHLSFRQLDEQLSPKQQQLVDSISEAVQWKDSPNFVEESNSPVFRMYSSYLSGITPKEEVMELLHQDKPAEAWAAVSTTGVSDETLELFVKYLAGKHQLYNVYALARMARDPSSEAQLNRVADYGSYEAILQAFVEPELVLTDRHVHLLKALRSQTQYLDLWKNEQFAASLKKALAKSELTIEDWTVTPEEQALIDKVILNLKWEEVPEFELDKNSQDFRDAAKLLIL